MPFDLLFDLFGACFLCFTQRFVTSCLSKQTLLYKQDFAMMCVNSHYSCVVIAYNKECVTGTTHY